MLQYSNGLCLAIIGSGGFAATMDGGVIRIFNGTRPANPNLKIPAGNVEIAKVTTEGKEFIPGSDPNGAGLRFRLGVNALVENFGRWDLVPSISGTAIWFRWNWRDVDPNDDSGYYPRIDGDVGLINTAADMIIERTNLVAGQRIVFDLFVASL